MVLFNRKSPGSCAKKRLNSLLAAVFATLLTGVSFGQTAKQVLPPQRSSLETVQPLPLATTTLANGLQIVVYEDHSVPIVTLEYANKTGSAVEPPEQSGFSHVLEHLFFMSNQATKDQASYLADVAKSGAISSAATREEVVSAYVTVASNYLPVTFRYLRDAIRQPLFLPEEVQRAKSEVLRELDRRSIDALAQFNTQLDNDLYYKYTSRKTPAGSSAVVETVTPDQLRSFWEKYWVPENSLLVLSGDVTPADAFAQAEQFFGDWKATQKLSASQVQIPEHPPMPRSSARILEGAGANVLIGIAWQGPSTGKDIDATYAADVFSGIVNQPGSRLQRLLVDSGVATVAHFNYFTQRNVGKISMTVLTTPDKVRDALKAINSEISHFADKDYFTVDEMGGSRQLLAVQELFEREKPTEFAHCVFLRIPPVIPIESRHRFQWKASSDRSEATLEMKSFPKWMTSVK